MQKGSTAVFLLWTTLLALSSVSNCQSLQSIDECETGFEIVGQGKVEQSLSWCLLGNIELCCRNINDLFGVSSGTPVSGCLCHNEVVEEIVTGAEQNPVASSFGFNRKKILELLDTCGADFGASGDCKVADPTPATNFKPSNLGKTEETPASDALLEVKEPAPTKDNKEQGPSEATVMSRVSSEVETTFTEDGSNTVKTVSYTATSTGDTELEQFQRVSSESKANKIDKEVKSLSDEEIMKVLPSNQDKKAFKNRLSSEVPSTLPVVKGAKSDESTSFNVGRTSFQKVGGPVPPKMKGFVSPKKTGQISQPNVINKQVYPKTQEVPLLPKRTGGPVFPDKTEEVVYLKPYEKPEPVQDKDDSGRTAGARRSIWRRIASFLGLAI